MAFAYLLLALLPIGAVGYIIWDHRRKAAQLEAVSAGRMEELLVVATHAIRPEPGDSALAPAAAAEQAHAPSFVLREKLLTPPQTLLYYLLKTGLPEYLVFAQMPVGALLDAAPHLAAYAREEQARMFARHVIDFAVFDKNTHPVAIVNLSAAAQAPHGASSQMRSWFTAAGLRYVELDAAALPRKDALRALIFGERSSADGSDTSAAISS